MYQMSWIRFYQEVYVDSLADNTTYILAGYIVNDTYNPGNQVIGMMLCNLHIYVSGEWGSYRNEADELIEQLDCSNPPSYVGPEYEIELIPLKRNQQAKAPQSNGKKDALRALGLAVNRREMTSGLETFLSIFSGGVDKRRQNLLP
ncbi:uncharacterized protein LOC123554227 [Mercenaria mercenaria]|uniref:uncharacterized protein LOC123554227 n=1 Tax=Mercenaria mercenaria TaxID=6596 RepID=UPI00234E910B|nr:uncharacterized protein LOC123554227 [Mercenaria mercenaria]